MKPIVVELPSPTVKPIVLSWPIFSTIEPNRGWLPSLHQVSPSGLSCPSLHHPSWLSCPSLTSEPSWFERPISPPVKPIVGRCPSLHQ
ncbi:unnamed protein product [Coregonus sp. 'balchen']|nr:unnamed protein product [Coregonus sp. 'balchen']